MTPRGCHMPMKLAGRQMAMVLVGLFGWASIACHGQASAQLPGDEDRAAIAVLPTAPPATTQNGNSPPLRIRRIHAPADRVQDWPRGNQRYVPIEPAEFERLIAGLANDPGGMAAASVARLTQARYTAVWQDGVLTGQALLSVVHDAPAAALLDLEPLQLAIQSAVWEAEGETPPAPALMGTNAEGKLSLLVERGGTLRLEWGLRAQSDSGGTLFQMALPRAPRSSLELDLPAALIPTTSAGLIVGAPELKGDRQTWRIELGGQHETRLRIAAGNMTQERKPLTLLRQSLTYDCSSRGVDLQAKLTLDVFHESLPRLPIVLDAGLQLVAARAGETPVPWTATTDPETGRTRAVLEFPEPLAGAGRVVRLTALAPLVTDERWRLPGIMLEDVSWQEGSATLLAPAPLVIEELLTHGCRQSKSGPLPGALAGEAIDLQYFSADAYAELMFSRQRQNVRMTSGIVHELSGTGISSRLTADLRLTQGERFQLEAEIPERWVIDSVQSVPPGAIADWTINPGRENSRMLVVRLARPLSPEGALRLTVTGRGLASPVSRVLSASELRMLRFVGVTADEQLLSVKTNPPHEARWLETEPLARLERGQLTDTQRDLLGANIGQDLFKIVGPAEAPFSAVIEPQNARFACQIRCEVTATSGPLTESYTFDCDPAGTRLDRVRVHFTQARPDRLEWTLGNDERTPLVARRAVPERNADGTLAAGETWEVQLGRPRGVRFTLHAQRTTPWHDKLALSLASVVDAASQQGQILIRAAGDVPVTISPHGLTPISTAPLASGDLRAAFRYDPNPRPSAARQTPITLARPDTAPRQQGTWAWHTLLQSRYDAGGGGLHWATFKLQNSGRSQITATLPPGAELLSAWVDQSPVYETLTNGKLRIALPAGHKFAVVTLQFATPATQDGPPLQRWLKQHAAPFPKLDVEQLFDEWMLWLPPGSKLLPPAAPWQIVDIPDLSWQQRLFGALARPPQLPRFDPALAADWRGLVAPHEDLKEAQTQVTQFLTRLGIALADAEREQQASSANVSTWDWGRILARAAPGTADQTFEVDPWGLAERGIAPRAPLPLLKNSSNNAHDRAAQFLQQEQLVLLSAGTTLRLTSVAALAASHTTTWPLEPAPVARLAAWPESSHSAPSAHGTIRAAAGAGVSFNAWRVATVDPWTINSAGDIARDQQGWTVYRLSGPHDVPLAARAVSGTLLSVLTVLAGLVTWLLLTVLFKRRPAAAARLAGLLAAVAMLVPAVYVPAASAAFWTAILCLVWGLFSVARRTRTPLVGQTKSVIFPLASTVEASLIVLCLVMVFTARSVQAQPPAPTSSTEATKAQADTTATAREPEPNTAGRGPVYQVFIPIDENKQPNGDRYLIPDALHTALRRAARSADGPRGWLLKRGVYRGTLARDAATNRLGLNTLQVRYDLRVFQGNTRVRIPLGQTGAALLPDQAALDGQPIDVQWSEDGTALVCDIPQAGDCLLEIALRPLPRDRDGTSGFELTIPPLPNTELELTLPADAPAIELPGDLAIRTISADRQLLTARLPPSSRLAVRWPLQGEPASAAAKIDVAELFWLKVQPGAVVLEARFDYNVTQGTVSVLPLAADPRLRLLPLEGDQPNITEVRNMAQVATGAGGASYEFQLAQPASGKLSLRVSFLVTGTSGVGNLRLPRLEAIAARSTRRWLGVSVDPTLEFDLKNLESFEPLGLAEFAAAWTPVANQPATQAATQPLVAYKIPSGETMWNLATRPRGTRTQAEQLLNVSCGRGGAVLHFTADLNTSAGEAFQHRVTAPPAMRVDQVSVIAGGVERAARHARQDNGEITLFLTGPVSGKQQLSLKGWLPMPIAGTVPCPVLKLENAELARDVVQVFRRPEVLVSIGSEQGLTPSEVAILGAGDSLGRLVKSLRATEPNHSATLALAPNRPQVTATQVTLLRSDGKLWDAEVSVRAQVKGGVLDALRFDVPAQWTRPFKLSPPVAHELVEIPGENRRQLVVRPRTAIEGDYQLTISGPLLVPAGDQPAAPYISLAATAQSEQYLALPTQFGVQQVNWETQQLRIAELPAGFMSTSITPEAFVTYQVTGSAPRAIMKSAERFTGQPQVHLMDIQVASDLSGSYRGVASFDIEPAGREHCLLRVPAEIRVVQVLLGGAPVSALSAKRETSGETWQLDLPSRSAPQRMEVIFRGSGGGEFSPWTSQSFAAPYLEELPVARSLWTVHAPAITGTVETDRIAPATENSAARVRLRSAADLADIGFEASLEWSPAELAGWYAPWSTRLTSAVGALEASEPSQPTSNTTATAQLQAELDGIVERMRERAERLAQAGMPPANDATESAGWLLDHALAAEGEPARFSGLGRLETLRVRTSPAQRFAYLYQGLAAAVATLVGLALGRLLRRGPPLDGALLSIHALGVAAGLVWWLWLLPSALGWVLIGISLWGAARAGRTWSRRRS